MWIYFWYVKHGKLVPQSQYIARYFARKKDNQGYGLCIKAFSRTHTQQSGTPNIFIMDFYIIMWWALLHYYDNEIMLPCQSLNLTLGSYCTLPLAHFIDITVSIEIMTSILTLPVNKLIEYKNHIRHKTWKSMIIMVQAALSFYWHW